MSELTPREKEILTLLALGFSMWQAALELDIKYQTIKNHCYNIYRRLNLKRPCVIAAIIQAVRTGQITLGQHHADGPADG